MSGFTKEDLAALAMSKTGGYVVLPAGTYQGTLGEVVVEEKDDRNGNPYLIATASIRNISPADPDDLDLIAEAAEEWQEGASPEEFLANASLRFQLYIFRPAAAKELHKSLLAICPEADKDDFLQACKDVKGSQASFPVKVEYYNDNPGNVVGKLKPVE